MGTGERGDEVEGMGRRAMRLQCFQCPPHSSSPTALSPSPTRLRLLPIFTNPVIKKSSVNTFTFSIEEEKKK